MTHKGYPVCELCVMEDKPDMRAGVLAPASIDGKHITWHRLCNDHAQSWTLPDGMPHMFSLTLHNPDRCGACLYCVYQDRYCSYWNGTLWWLHIIDNDTGNDEGVV